MRKKFLVYAIRGIYKAGYFHGRLQRFFKR